HALLERRTALADAGEADVVVADGAVAAHGGAVREWLHPHDDAAVIAGEAVDLLLWIGRIGDDGVAELLFGTSKEHFFVSTPYRGRPARWRCTWATARRRPARRRR